MVGFDNHGVCKFRGSRILSINFRLFRAKIRQFFLLCNNSDFENAKAALYLDPLYLDSGLFWNDFRKPLLSLTWNYFWFSGFTEKRYSVLESKKFFKNIADLCFNQNISFKIFIEPFIKNISFLIEMHILFGTCYRLKPARISSWFIPAVRAGHNSFVSPVKVGLQNIVAHIFFDKFFNFFVFSFARLLSALEISLRLKKSSDYHSTAIT